MWGAAQTHGPRARRSSPRDVAKILEQEKFVSHVNRQLVAQCWPQPRKKARCLVLPSCHNTTKRQQFGLGGWLFADSRSARFCCFMTWAAGMRVNGCQFTCLTLVSVMVDKI